MAFRWYFYLVSGLNYTKGNATNLSSSVSEIDLGTWDVNFICLAF